MVAALHRLRGRCAELCGCPSLFGPVLVLDILLELLHYIGRRRLRWLRGRCELKDKPPGCEVLALEGGVALNTVGNSGEKGFGVRHRNDLRCVRITTHNPAVPHNVRLRIPATTVSTSAALKGHPLAGSVWRRPGKAGARSLTQRAPHETSCVVPPPAALKQTGRHGRPVRSS